MAVLFADAQGVTDLPAGDSRSRWSNQPLGGDRCLHPRRHVELLEDVGDVHARRLGADEQLLADLPVGAPLAEQAQHLELAGREARAPRARRRTRRRRRRPRTVPSEMPARRARSATAAASGSAPSSSAPAAASPRSWTAVGLARPGVAAEERLGLTPAGVGGQVHVGSGTGSEGRPRCGGLRMVEPAAFGPGELERSMERDRPAADGVFDPLEEGLGPIQAGIRCSPNVVAVAWRRHSCAPSRTRRRGGASPAP